MDVRLYLRLKTVIPRSPSSYRDHDLAHGILLLHGFDSIQAVLEFESITNHGPNVMLVSECCESFDHSCAATKVTDHC